MRIRVTWPDGRSHDVPPQLDELLEGGSMPYHPIASLGSRIRLHEAHVPPMWWTVCAPLIEHVWNSLRRPGREFVDDDVVLADALVESGARLAQWHAGDRPPALPHKAIPVSIATRVVRAVREAGAVTTAGSVAAASTAVRAWSLSPTCDRRRLDYLREGHTSSVFVAGPPTTDGRASVVNVARDATDAADDLRAATHQQEAWAALAPDVVAAVQQVGEVEVVGYGATLPFNFVELVPDARELHVIPGRDGARMVPVDRFDHGPTGSPHLLSRDATATASNALWAATVRSAARLVKVRPDGGALAVSISVNDGDAVLTPIDGAFKPNVRFVACDDKPWEGHVRMLPFRLILANAQDDGPDDAGLLWWNRPDIAVRQIAAVWLRNRDDGAEIWDAARSVSAADVATAFAAPSELAAAAVEAVSQLSRGPRDG